MSRAPPGCAIIIESRFQTDKRSRKRDRASASLLTPREREGNIARIEDTNYTRTTSTVCDRLVRPTKGAGAGGRNSRGRRLTGEGVGESSGASSTRADRTRSMTLITIALVVPHCLRGFQKVKRVSHTIPPPPHRNSLLPLCPLIREFTCKILFAGWRVWRRSLGRALKPNAITHFVDRLATCRRASVRFINIGSLISRPGENDNNSTRTFSEFRTQKQNNDDWTAFECDNSDLWKRSYTGIYRVDWIYVIYSSTSSSIKLQKIEIINCEICHYFFTTYIWNEMIRY